MKYGFGLARRKAVRERARGYKSNCIRDKANNMMADMLFAAAAVAQPNIDSDSSSSISSMEWKYTSGVTARAARTESARACAMQ